MRPQVDTGENDTSEFSLPLGEFHVACYVYSMQ